MRVLLTRPLEDAEALVAPLRALGIETLVEPMLSIEYGDGPQVDLTGVQAILITSANGVRALARRCGDRRLPVFAVGDASARTARKAGFAAVESASGDVDDLARLVAARLDAGAGALLHVAGKSIAGDLGGLVRAAGFDYRRQVLYESRQREQFSEATAQAMAAKLVDGVLFFSPRTAATFVSLARAAGLTEVCHGMIAYCLSPAVADRASAIAWSRVCIAARPDQTALMAVVQEDLVPAGDNAEA